MSKKGKIILIVFSSIVALVLLVKVLTIAFLEPWIEEKIETSLNDKYPEYKIDIDKVHILFLSLGVELETILIRSRTELETDHDLRGEIQAIKLKRINISKFLSDNDLDIGEVRIIHAILKGEIPTPKEKKPPGVSSMNIHIGKIVFSDIELAVKSDSSAQTYSVKKGTLNIYHVQLSKQDTISTNIIKEFDFKTEEFVTVLSDSTYTLTVHDIAYSAKSKNLFVKDFIVHPNYSDYAFTARKKYQIDCIRATLKNISVDSISAIDFIKYKSLVCSYVEIGQMEMHVFRDRRKEFHHVVKPMFQNLLYDYKGLMKIDSIGLVKANVYYVEHVESAVQPGKVSFNEISATIYNVTNDTVYKTKEGFFELKGKGLFMGKGRVTVLLKAKLYEPRNTFSLNGTLSPMEASGINPMLEKNAFIYVTAGKIDGIHFNMWADKHKATGKMTMLYHDLDVAIKSKKTNDTTALKEKVISIVANKKLMDSNPEPGEKAREGTIDYERDPEKFIFNYCFKAILSGMKSSLSKAPKEKKHKK